MATPQEMAQILYQRTDDYEPSFNVRLIESVKNCRCIFDSTDRHYRNLEYKTRVWNRLVTVLNFDGDPRALMARWKQLRDKFGKEKRKVKYSGEQSTWQHYLQLSSFLEPFMTDRGDASPSRKENQEVILTISDPTFNSRLIEEVKANPCLFDVRDPKYRHADCRTNAWANIIANLNYPGGVASIYKQWKKVRDRFVREKRRQKMMAEIGVNETSTWDLFDSLTWMIPYLEERNQNRATPGKRHEINISDYEDVDDDSYYMMDKRGASGEGTSGGGGGDVLLDGDSAFSASVVSDLRTLPEHIRIVAKQQVEILLETGKMPTYG